MNKAELEEKTLYRIIRVGYVVTFGLLFVLWVDRAYIKHSPEEIVDATASKVLCEDGRVYEFELLESYQSHYPVQNYDRKVQTEHRLNANVYDLMSKSICKYSVAYDAYNPRPLPDLPNYEVYEVTKSIGSWNRVIALWVIGFVGLYVVLNIIRDTLNYMFFGKPFTFDWLGGRGRQQ